MTLTRSVAFSSSSLEILFCSQIFLIGSISTVKQRGAQNTTCVILRRTTYKIPSWTISAFISSSEQSIKKAIRISPFAAKKKHAPKHISWPHVSTLPLLFINTSNAKHDQYCISAKCEVLTVFANRTGSLRFVRFI